MNGSTSLPPIETLKRQAKRLRVELENSGNSINHSRSLELLAHQHGFKDWNTLHAVIGNQPQPCPVTLGQRVRGHYLGQPFEGNVIGIKNLITPGRFRVSFNFDDPVDVVTFDSFSSFRKRVSCSIGCDGMTTEKTSNGQPQLKLVLQVY